ncbi:MAG: molybdopterin-dependent oxidoreductase, partial [Acidimicrobiales bacterium]
MTTLTRESPTEPEPATGSGTDRAGMAGRYQSDLHDTRNAAWLGLALGVTFTVSFATGLLSHLIQHPFAGFEWLARPAGLYRVTQGLH